MVEANYNQLEDKVNVWWPILRIVMTNDSHMKRHQIELMLEFDENDIKIFVWSIYNSLRGKQAFEKFLFTFTFCAII